MGLLYVWMYLLWVFVVDVFYLMFVSVSTLFALSVYIAFTVFFFFFQAEDGIRDVAVTGVQTCALPISGGTSRPVCRSSMTSGMPPRRLAMAGQPAIAASVSDSGNPSRCVEGRTTRSSADRTAGAGAAGPPEPPPPSPPPPPPPGPSSPAPASPPPPTRNAPPHH